MKEQILQEVKERREQCVKHFRMAQKGMAAAVYPSPVHYEKDGQWEEIDNRLEPVMEDGREVYKNRASSLKVCFAGELGEDSLVTVEKDGRKVSWRLDTPTQPESGASAQLSGGLSAQPAYSISTQPVYGETAEDVSNELRTASEESAKVCSGKRGFQVLEKSEFWKDPAVLREEKNAAARSETVAAESETAVTRSETAVSRSEDSELVSEPVVTGTDTAQSAEGSNGQLDVATVREKMGVPHLLSEGMYEGVLPGVDLHYALHGERIKENIRIHTRTAAQQPFVFSFSHPGMEMRMEEDGSMGLYAKTSGENTVDVQDDHEDQEDQETSGQSE